MSGEKVRQYRIGGVVMEQRPLVLGQIRQLMEVLKGATIPAEAGAMELLAILGDRLPRALAVVLCPEGQQVLDKNLDELAGWLEFAMDADAAIRVVEDFFVCNPVVSLLDRLTGATGKLAAATAREEARPETGSSDSALSSPTATSPEETPSSGASPRKSARPGSTTGAGK